MYGERLYAGPVVERWIVVDELAIENCRIGAGRPALDEPFLDC